MLIAIISTFVFFFHSLFLGSCGVLVLDDKRQDQIPLPRIGRGNGLPILPPSIYYHILVPIALPTLGDANVIDGPSTRDELNAWVLSHLDRRKRSLMNASSKYIGLQKGGRPYASSNYNQQHVMAIEDLIRRSPWAIWALKGVDKKMAFSPRLGRAMTPRLGKKSHVMNEFDGDSSLVDKKAQAFSPRLGRAMDQEPDSSFDLVNVETRAAFSPRLGRADKWSWGRWSGKAVNTRASTFAPRLGRSYTDFNSSDTNATNELKM